MADALTIEAERSKGDRRRFVDLPYRLNRACPAWVPPLRMADAAVMDARKNPFFQHAEVRHFLARRGERVVGRIAAIENRRHNEFHADRLGFFGWFDAEDDPEAARGLVDAARRWVGERGLSGMRGPVCYSTNDVCGVLVEGFDLPPAILMPWNQRYYDGLLTGSGLVPVKDLVAYEITTAALDLARLERVTSRALARGGYTMRQIDLSRWAAEVDLLLDLYNRTWERNWGFVPMTEAEFRHAAKDLRRIIDPRIFLIVEQAGRPVGFVGLLPDVNVALKGLDGRLLPFNVFRLMRRMKKIGRARIVMLGVLPEARGRGLDAALITTVIARGVPVGYLDGEAGWILEDNLGMRTPIESMGSRVSKRYRLYETPPV
ncbi:MAG TPA: GNAT family N-acetyltransferase [Planctomycetota bacterium]|nr:GNAT family N-acetyltransferase [Planctomycetota bacterium]